MKPKISVVIPVYNVEKYLVMCVDSVLNQTFQDFEIILVDDGSTDNSGFICDSINDRRVRVIHKQNSGLSDTRNKGTEAALGEYITYIDSDDTIQDNYLEILFSLIAQYDAVISSCELMVCKEGENPIYLKKLYENGVLQGIETLKLILQGKIHGTSACGLLIKKEIAEAYKFPFGKYHEDDLTTYKYFMNADKVAYTKKPLYTYYQRGGSIMHKPFSQIDIDELDAADQIYEDCKRLGDEVEEAALVKKTSNYCQILFKFPDLKKISPQTYERLNSFIDKELIKILSNKYIGRRTKIIILLYKAKLLFLVRKLIGNEI